VSVTDHFSNFRVLITTKQSGPLKGLQAAWGEGVSAHCMQTQRELCPGARRPSSAGGELDPLSGGGGLLFGIFSHRSP